MSVRVSGRRERPMGSVRSLRSHSSTRKSLRAAASVSSHGSKHQLGAATPASTASGLVHKGSSLARFLPEEDTVRHRTYRNCDVCTPGRRQERRTLQKASSAAHTKATFMSSRGSMSGGGGGGGGSLKAASAAELLRRPEEDMEQEIFRLQSEASACAAACLCRQLLACLDVCGCIDGC